LTTTRAAHALPETAFVFCCFNNAYKITPAVFDSWMQILAAVPTSVLWLLENNPQASANLRREAVRRTIDPARLIFAAPVPHAEHLARLALANLFLDTFPYTAHTTASDALSVGLPVLTRIGESFPSRVAASLLRAIPLPELITTTPADYQQLAITLAHDAPRYQTLRTRLQHNLTTTPLFNSPLFTRDLESLYLTLRPTLDDRPARTAVTS
jgi:predicted O-linked N-acetylglucosamine transferase (SPINDLY family)